eukprot:15417_1
MKKQLQTEKDIIIKMQNEIENTKIKNEREQLIIHQEFQRKHNDKEILLLEKKILKHQSEAIAIFFQQHVLQLQLQYCKRVAILRKELESQKHIMDTELAKNKLKMKDIKKRFNKTAAITQ